MIPMDVKGRGEVLVLRVGIVLFLRTQHSLGAPPLVRAKTFEEMRRAEHQHLSRGCTGREIHILRVSPTGRPVKA